jgi:hypothetical protein
MNAKKRGASLFISTIVPVTLAILYILDCRDRCFWRALVMRRVPFGAVGVSLPLGEETENTLKSSGLADVKYPSRSNLKNISEEIHF